MAFGRGAGYVFGDDAMMRKYALGVQPAVSEVRLILTGPKTGAITNIQAYKQNITLPVEQDLTNFEVYMKAGEAFVSLKEGASINSKTVSALVAQGQVAAGQQMKVAGPLPSSQATTTPPSVTATTMSASPKEPGRSRHSHATSREQAADG